MNFNKIKEFFLGHKVLTILGILVLILIFITLISPKKQTSKIQENISPTPTIEDYGVDPGVDSGDTPLDYILPYEEKDFIVVKYIGDKKLLVKAKTDNMEEAKENLKKWLDLYEENPGENTIVWE